jgi:hypothetical protein
VTDARCVLPHKVDPNRPRPAADGLLVCRGCRAKMLRQLRQLGPLDRTLAARAALAAGGATGSRSAETRLPMDVEAATVRLKVRGFLASWVQLVAEERGFTPPSLAAAARTTIPRHETTSRGGLRLRVGALSTVDHLAVWLERSHDWLCAHPAVDEYADELGELHGEAFRRCYPGTRRRFIVAPCPFDLVSDVATRISFRCAVGRLVVAFRPGEDPLPDAECDTCGWSLDPRHWLLLADQHRRLTAVELSALWDVPLKTVERWARDDAWPHDDGRPRRYLASEAQATHDAHRVEVAG